MMNIKTVFCILLTTILVPQSQVIYGDSTAEKNRLSLYGTASGGTLTLVQNINRKPRNVSIITAPGESATSVAQRLANAINDLDPFKWFGPKHFSLLEQKIPLEGSSLTFPGPKGSYVLAGSEIGLGIPKPPLSLSARYDADNQQIILDWINPAEGYQTIFIVKEGVSTGPFPGTMTSYTMRSGERDLSNLDFGVVGYIENTPSNVGTIHLRHNVQEELSGHPCSNGISPNWSAWSLEGKSNLMVYEQVERKFDTKKYVHIRNPSDKPFYCLLKTTSSDAVGGIQRKFLGLTPGRSYEISIRINTLGNGDPFNGTLCSVHAAPDSMASGTLTPQQLAGIAPLSNTSSGAPDATFAVFNTENSTKGKFVTKNTVVSLPDDVTSLTVWIKLQGHNSQGIAMDWISVEEITSTN